MARRKLNLPGSPARQMADVCPGSRTH